MTEIYISLDGSTFNKLDIDKSEAIVMKYILKDLQDISKVFSPFSQDFTFKATPRNQRALSYFGDTTVIRTNTDNKYHCKIYTDGVLNLTGKLQVKERSDIYGAPDTFVASFGTFMTSLKDRIGKDTIQDLSAVRIDYTANDIKDLLQNTRISGGVKYHIPFMSNNRVWQIDEQADSESKDNILYKNTSAIGSDKYINDREIMPAVSMLSILNLIKQKYNLDIVAPIESRPEVSEAYILCNSSEIRNAEFYKWDFPENQISHLGPNGKYILTQNTSTSWLNVQLNPSAPNLQSFFRFRFYIKNKYGNDSYDNPDTKGRIRLVRYGTDEILFQDSFDSTNGEIEILTTLTDSVFVDNNLRFQVFVSFDNFCIHKETSFAINYQTTGGTSVYTTGNAFNAYRYYYSGDTYSSYNKRRIDIIKALPKVSVLDFIESYLKTFNLKIFDTSPNDDRLYFITPSDIDTSGLAYSKATVDYTEYIDPKSVKKKAMTSYNYYNFKHQNSKYKSNADYLSATGIEYGQTFFPNVVPSKPVEYKIETKFSIIPPVNVFGTINMFTAYGFTAEKPVLTQQNNFIYKPNYDELTIFYRRQRLTPTEIGVQGYTSGLPVVSQIASYASPVPFNSVNNSLAFSILVINGTNFYDSLYSRGYDKEIQRLLNPNTLQHSIKLKLPNKDIYLNEATTQQDGGDTPTGFRLQNDCIIGETRYSFVDCNIDITTGNTTATLLNY